MRIAIVGSGGVGGYYGGRLAASGCDVIFFARGAHLDALRAHGLRIHSPLGDLRLPQVQATDDSATVGPVDVVFVTVKQYDTESALRLLPPLIGAETVVVPFQNGLESVDRLIRTVGGEHTAAGAAYVTATIEAPGVIRHTVNDRLIFGELDGARSARLERLRTACVGAGLDARLSETIEIDVWTKFVWVTVLSGLTAVTRLPVGRICSDPDLLALGQAAMMEGMKVARAKGIVLPAQVFDDFIPNLEELPPQAKPSMLQDLERGKPLELPWLSGAIVRMGEELGVLTPTHRFIATVLGPHVGGHTTG